MSIEQRIQAYGLRSASGGLKGFGTLWPLHQIQETSLALVRKVCFRMWARHVQPWFGAVTWRKCTNAATLLELGLLWTQRTCFVGRCKFVILECMRPPHESIHATRKTKDVHLASIRASEHPCPTFLSWPRSDCKAASLCTSCG